MKKWGVILAIVMVSGCGIFKPRPGTNTDTQVHVVDSTVYHVIDSLRITEATRYKDMAWLGDTLRIDGIRSRMWAYADTTREAVIGGLEEEKVEEKVRIVWKDKLVYKDSIQVKEVPVEVEKVREVIPKFFWWSLAFNILAIILAVVWTYLRFFKK